MEALRHEGAKKAAGQGASKHGAQATGEGHEHQPAKKAKKGPPGKGQYRGPGQGQRRDQDIDGKEGQGRGQGLGLLEAPEGLRLPLKGLKAQERGTPQRKKGGQGGSNDGEKRDTVHRAQGPPWTFLVGEAPRYTRGTLTPSRAYPWRLP